MSDIYAIIDVENYAKEMRSAAAAELCENTTEDLDQYISVQQTVNLIRNACVGFDDQSRPLLNEYANEEIFDNITKWIYNVGIAKLAAQDLIECAWDDDTNEMIFWIKEASISKPNKTKKSTQKKKKN